MIIGKSSKCNFIQEISNSRKKKILSYLTKKDREKNINTYIQKEKQKGKERKERKKERKKEQRIMGDRKRQKETKKWGEKGNSKNKKKRWKERKDKTKKNTNKNRMTNYARLKRIKERKHGIANREETSQTQKNQGKSRRGDWYEEEWGHNTGQGWTNVLCDSVFHTVKKNSDYHTNESHVTGVNPSIYSHMLQLSTFWGSWWIRGCLLFLGALVSCQ